MKEYPILRSLTTGVVIWGFYPRGIINLHINMKHFVDFDFSQLPEYADLSSDAGFKAVLADPANKELLRGFLNLLLPPERQIQKIVHYSDRELPGFTTHGRGSRLDLRCVDQDGVTFLVEMQRRWHDSFFERCVWYMSSVYGSELEQGDEYSKIHPVYLISILSEKLPHTDESAWANGEFISRYELTEKRTGELAPETIMAIFVELGRFKKETAGELKTALDQVCYQFKCNEMTPEFKEGLIAGVPTELVEARTVAGYTTEKKLNFVKNMFNERDYRAEIASYRKEAKREGIAEGLERGMAKGFERGCKEGKVLVAKKFLSAGISLEKVMEITGLSRESLESV